MTLRKNWQVIYALTLVLVAGRVWAEEKKAIPSPAAAPKCCSESPNSPCTRCCAAQTKSAIAVCPGEACDQCKAPTSSKLVTRIYPLGAFFEARECMEEQETPMLSRGTDPLGAGVRKLDLEGQLIKLVTNHIKPQSWASMGGEGTIDFYSLGKALVVSAKPETQAEIAKFLNELRTLTGPGTEEEEAMAVQCLPAPFAFMKIMTPPAPAWLRAPIDSSAMRINPRYTMAAPPYSCPMSPAFYPPAPPTPAEVARALADYSPGRPTPEILPPPRVAMEPGAPVQQCVAVQPPSPIARTCIIRAKSEGGKTQLEMENGCMGVHATCDSMELKTAGPDSLKLSAQQNQIRIDGRAFRAAADSIHCNGANEWVLEGHVQFSCNRDGATAQIRGNRITVSLKCGQIEFKIDGAGSLQQVIQPASYSGAGNEARSP